MAGASRGKGASRATTGLRHRPLRERLGFYSVLDGRPSEQEATGSGRKGPPGCCAGERQAEGTAGRPLGCCRRREAGRAQGAGTPLRAEPTGNPDGQDLCERERERGVARGHHRPHREVNQAIPSFLPPRWACVACRGVFRSCTEVIVCDMTRCVPALY